MICKYMLSYEVAFYTMMKIVLFLTTFLLRCKSQTIWLTHFSVQFSGF